MILRELAKYDPITIQCHDNPDADSIAAGYALCRYFEACLLFTSEAAGGGEWGDSGGCGAW